MTKDELKELRFVNFTDEDLIKLVGAGWKCFDNVKDHLYRPGNNFSSYLLCKTEEGFIYYSDHYPINVDCDSGSYDSEHNKKVYQNLEDFLKRRTPVYSETYMT